MPIPDFIHHLLSVQSVSLILLLLGIGLAFSQIRLSGWVLGWILLSGALLLQGFRTMLSHVAGSGGVDAATYAIANDWMGLGFSLLVVAAMHMMREVFARHRLAAESLRVFSAAANDAIIVMDKSGTIATWNQAAHRIFGYSEQAAQGRKLGELIVPQRCRADFATMFNQFGNDDRGSVGDTPAELAGLRKDGNEIVTECSISRVIVDGKWHAIYIVRDITARKRAEEEIRERAVALEMLSAKILSSNEMDRKTLAFDLQEGLAQSLVTIKLRIEDRLHQFEASKASDESPASIIAELQQAIRDVQAIATGLRPSILDELGLLPTIDWYCRKFERLHPAIGVGVGEKISVREKDVPVPLKIVIYRIIESVFTNIARYEGTDQIGLALQLERGAITLAIDDKSQDARYAATAERETDLKMRFAEARERTTLSGGSFTIARGYAGGVALRSSWAV